MALQHSLVLEEHTLQCVVIGHRRFGNGLEVPYKYTLTGRKQLIELEFLTLSGSFNILLPILIVNIMNHIYRLI